MTRKELEQLRVEVCYDYDLFGFDVDEQGEMIVKLIDKELGTIEGCDLCHTGFAGKAYGLIPGSPDLDYSEFNYCPNCGKRIEEVEG